MIGHFTHLLVLPDCGLGCRKHVDPKTVNCHKLKMRDYLCQVRITLKVRLTHATSPFNTSANYFLD